MEKEAQHKLPFLDVSIDNNNTFLTRVYCQKKKGKPLVVYELIISVSTSTLKKVGLIRTLVDNKINNISLGLH